MTRYSITFLFCTVFVLHAFHSDAQQFPHSRTYYHNGNSIVRLNVALDQLQLGAGRVRLNAPLASIGALNSRAESTGAPAQAIAYREGVVSRQDDFAEILTRRAVVMPSEGKSIDALAVEYGFTVLRVIIPHSNLYEIDVKSVSLTASLNVANALYESSDAVIAQPVFRRPMALRRILNDTKFSDLWHLYNTRNDAPYISGNDAKLVDAWDFATGAGVNILVVDAGVEVAHSDLSPNTRTDIDIDFLNADDDPTPFSSHGTSVAGVAAAKGDNNLDVAGVAFDASIIAARLIDSSPAPSPSDTNILDSFSYLVNESVVMNQTHISNNSWGPSDSNSSVKVELTPAEELALLDGVTNGRNGKGVVYVWAAGNGRSANQNISADGFASSRFTIAVGASGGDGVYSSYSEPGASMLVTAPSSFQTEGVWSTRNGNATTSSFGGTSAAAPLVSGVVALMLEVNPSLTWRDVQAILVQTSTKIDLSDTGWFVNGAGHQFNHNYGFGRVNARNAVLTAAIWNNLDPLLPTLSASESSVGGIIPDNITNGVNRNLTINTGSDFLVEHVELTLNVTHLNRGDLAITLTSPSGSKSVLTQLHNDTADDYDNWKFTSVVHWGEDPVGNWRLNVSDQKVLDVGTINSWTLDVFGTSPQVASVPGLKVPFFSVR